MKHKLRLFIGFNFLALTKFPSDELGKALLCKSEGNPSITQPSMQVRISGMHLLVNYAK
jgi:hypothetical protein